MFGGDDSLSVDIRQVCKQAISALPDRAGDKDASVQVIDLDADAWASIKDAASKSPWMPPEYCMNDWVSDVCAFLLKPEEYQDNAPAAPPSGRGEGGDYPAVSVFSTGVTTQGRFIRQKDYDTLRQRLAEMRQELQKQTELNDYAEKRVLQLANENSMLSEKIDACDYAHNAALDRAAHAEALLAASKAGKCLKCGIGPRRETCAYPEACEHPGLVCALERNQALLGLAEKEALLRGGEEGVDRGC